MHRWIVVFVSHCEGPADVHFVSVRSSSPLHAVRDALSTKPPLHPWVFAEAKRWPRGAKSIDDLALAYGT